MMLSESVKIENCHKFNCFSFAISSVGFSESVKSQFSIFTSLIVHRITELKP